MRLRILKIVTILAPAIFIGLFHNTSTTGMGTEASQREVPPDDINLAPALRHY